MSIKICNLSCRNTPERELAALTHTHTNCVWYGVQTRVLHSSFLQLALPFDKYFYRLRSTTTWQAQCTSERLSMQSRFPCPVMSLLLCPVQACILPSSVLSPVLHPTQFCPVSCPVSCPASWPVLSCLLSCLMCCHVSCPVLSPILYCLLSSARKLWVF